MTPDDVAAIRAFGTEWHTTEERLPAINALADALEQAWAERDEALDQRDLFARMVNTREDALARVRELLRFGHSVVITQNDLRAALEGEQQ